MTTAAQPVPALRTRWSHRIPAWSVLYAVPVAALAVGYLSLRSSKVSDIGPYGLIQALHPPYFAAVVALMLSYFGVLRMERLRPTLLSLHLGVLVFLVHGAPGVVESEPRFATAYLHAGFTGYVAHTGQVLPGIDARFSWPAFFTGSAVLDKAAGISTALHLIRWWPVAMNIAYVALLWLIAVHLLPTKRLAWLTAGFFPVANWVGQDYYSPQSIGFVLYLALIFVLVGPLGGEGPPIWRMRVRRPRSWPGPTAEEQDRWGPTWLWISGSVVLVAAMSAGHQISPIMACGTSIVLAAAGRTRARPLVVAFCVITLGWVCYGAIAFWSGHFGEIFGQVGTVSGNVSNSVLKRLHGSLIHRRVVDVRLGISVFVWVLGGLGALTWRKGGANRRAAFLMMAWPISFIAVQSYGGEALLRIFFFSLPGALICIVALISRLRWSPAQIAAEVLVFAVLAPSFLVARWGNELFEITRPLELAGVQQLYKMAPHGSIVVSISPQIPWSFDNVTTYQYEPENIDEFALRKLRAIESLFKPNKSYIVHVRNRSTHRAFGYVIITTGQVNYGDQEYGLPTNWGQEDITKLTNSPKFQLVYHNPDTWIFKYYKPIKPFKPSNQNQSNDTQTRR
jgi:hypothetical protein